MSDQQNTKKAPARARSPKIFRFAGIFGVVLILLSLFVSIYVIDNMDIRINNIRIKTTETKIELNDLGLTSIGGLKRLDKPVYIDLRGNKIPAEEVLTLIDRFPECKILWSVPIGSEFIDCNNTDIVVADMSIDEVPLLGYFTELKSIDARGLDIQTVDAIKALSLDCSVQWDIPLGNKRFEYNATKVSIGSDATADDIQRLLLFPELESVDARGCTEYDQLMDISDKLPNCNITWSVPVGPVECLNTDEILDFKKTPVNDINKLEKDFANFKYLPALKSIDMSGCGVPNEKMAEWREKYADTYKFVWEVYITLGKEVIPVRTDIKVFSSLRTPYIPHGDQDTYRDLFLYCTDLVAIDLGHNNITDISLITNLKKLQAVILMDNPIRDFSPLAELPELVFAEINKTKIKDVSFVSKCPKLMHLDISETPSKDITPITESKSLKYCVLVLSGVSDKDLRRLKTSLPDCMFAQVYADFDFVRNSPLRSEFRKAFKNFKSIETFEDWTNYTFVEGAEIILPNDYKPPEYYTNRTTW